MSDEKGTMADAHDIVDDGSYSRAFDFFKHLTTTALISIGGVLGLLTGEAAGISARAVAIVIFLLSLAGMISMMSLCGISTLAMLQRPKLAKHARELLILQYSASFLLIAGLGIFLGAFSKVLSSGSGAYALPGRS